MPRREKEEEGEIAQILLRDEKVFSASRIALLYCILHVTRGFNGISSVDVSNIHTSSLSEKHKK